MYILNVYPHNRCKRTTQKGHNCTELYKQEVKQYNNQELRDAESLVYRYPYRLLVYVYILYIQPQSVQSEQPDVEHSTNRSYAVVAVFYLQQTTLQSRPVSHQLMSLGLG